MTLALKQAEQGAQAQEVPVGAVVVRGDRLVAQAHNQTRGLNDPTAHAEILALREAARLLGNHRLTDCTLYVTLEPCAMCAGAALHARLQRVVYGAAEPKFGADGSTVPVLRHPALNHATQVVCSVLADQCSALLQVFFQQRRLDAQTRHRLQFLRDDALRTPEARFAQLQPLGVQSRYVATLAYLQGLRMHYIDSAPHAPPGETALVFLHGLDGWSWSWRTAWGSACGQRVLCPDLIGFGRSDKPKKPDAYGWDWHAQVLAQWLDGLGLRRATWVYHPDMVGLIHRLQRQNRVTAARAEVPPTLDAQAAAAPYPYASFGAVRTALAQGNPNILSGNPFGP